MGQVVEGMNRERWLIFRCFGVGLICLLQAVACSTWLLMHPYVAGAATCLLFFTCYALVSNAMRIFTKFELKQVRDPPPCTAGRGCPGVVASLPRGARATPSRTHASAALHRPRALSARLTLHTACRARWCGSTIS